MIYDYKWRGLRWGPTGSFSSWHSRVPSEDRRMQLVHTQGLAEILLSLDNLKEPPYYAAEFSIYMITDMADTGDIIIMMEFAFESRYRRTTAEV
jgi:hypothetical protein